MEVGTEVDDIRDAKKVERLVLRKISTPINNSTRTRTVGRIGWFGSRVS